jgi:hypothetical protein
MKKNLLIVLGSALCLLSTVLKSQTYSAWGKAINQTGHMFDSIAVAGDSLKFDFVNANATAWGNPQLIVYYEGNFGNFSDVLDVYDETLGYAGTTNPSTYGYDCSPEDSTVISLSASSINSWTSNNVIRFTLIPNAGISPCTFSRVRVRLVYNYCLSGLPSQYATPSITSSLICSSEGPFTLTGVPSGGTFFGTGVTGSVFNPANLSSGTYAIGYTATDSQSCTTTGYVNVTVKPQPIVNNNSTVYACIGQTVNLNAQIGSSFIWFSNAALTNSIIVANPFITPSLTQTTNYWVASPDQNNSLNLTAVTNSAFAIIDHNALSGDDRGGIAVTQTHIYYNGDNNCVRYDLALTPSTGISLPVRDGMFSDLRTGKLWTLWNTTLNAPPVNSPNSFNANAIRGLDSNLNFTNEYVNFSQTINLGYNMDQNGIFAGTGLLGLYSGNTQHWYVVDLDNGAVSDLGFLSSAQLYGSENWSDWGVLESNCGGSYSVIYRSYLDADIHRRVIPNGTVTTVGTFSGLSDMASLTYSPWNNRWYWHYEGSSTSFGGTSETLGYASATSTTAVCPGGGLSCAAKVTVNVPVDVTLIIPSDTVCLENGPISLNGGAPAGGNYSGVGVGTNTSGTVFYPALAGPGTYTINYTYTDMPSGCTDMAKQEITVDLCTGINGISGKGVISIFPNPNNGVFNLTVNSDMHETSVEITDLRGSVVYSSNKNTFAAGQTTEIDLSSFAAGMYLVKVTDAGQSQLQRIIIMK